MRLRGTGHGTFKEVMNTRERIKHILRKYMYEDMTHEWYNEQIEQLIRDCLLEAGVNVTRIKEILGETKQKELKL